MTTKKISLFLLTIVMLTGCVGINQPSPMDIYMQNLLKEAQQRQGSGQAAPVQFASEDGSFTTDVPSFSAVAKGGDFEVTFKTPYSWSAEVVASTKANGIDWVSLSKTRGNAGVIDLVITLKENETYDARAAIVNIKSGDYTYHIKLFQGQKDAILVSETDVKLGKEAQTYTLHSQTNLENVELVIPTNCDWIKKVSTKGLVAKNFELSISENKTSSTRSAELTLQNVKSGVSQKVTITQDKGEAFLTVSPTEFSVGKEGGEIEFTVTGNVDWDCFFSRKEVDEFLSIEYLDDNTARCEITILPNPESSARVLEISIIANDYPSLGTELQVSQAAGYNYFYFENLSQEESTCIQLQKAEGAPDVSLEYSFDGGYWEELSSDGFNLDPESKVYFRAKDDNTGFGSGVNNYNYFSSSSDAPLKVGGNILYLLKPDGDVTEFEQFAFVGLFNGNSSLQYANDFDLPGFVSYACYCAMFNGCTKLETAPELPSTELAEYCYSNMFSGCTSLETSPALPATELAKNCYSNMFNGCTSLETAPALPATGLADGCYNMMFVGCVKLETAPELSATTLAYACYYNMFNGCTSLKTAPELPATTLAKSCYYYMFQNCSKLSSVTMLATDISASDCLTGWLTNAGTEAENPVLYVHPSMAGNEIIESEKWIFDIKAASGKLPDGSLSGVFTVNADGKKVYFSQGNLQATYSASTGTYSFGFAANQYDQIGNAAGNTTINSQADGEVVDLFSWSTDAANNNWGIHSYNEYNTGNFKDWGTAVGAGNTWRTLSNDEWKYLLKTRSVNNGIKEGYSYQRATIKLDATAGIFGIIIYPDNYTSQTGATEYSITEWTTMEAAGCVFLPAAGRRVQGNVVGQFGNYGYYWSSSASSSESNSAQVTYFYDFDLLFIYTGQNRGYGYSVRLVKDASVAPAATKGTAKATIGGGEVDVNWVQLWADGPKFAEYNVGVSSATETGTMMYFREATAENFTWGTNWCTPSKDQMNQLLLAAKGNSDSKVTCEYCEYTAGNGKWGFKFTGKETGYTSNSVFFPSHGGSSSNGYASYWSSTDSGDNVWSMYLRYSDGGWGSEWSGSNQFSTYLVRPVLKN